MKRRKLGGGQEVFAVGLGCMGMSGSYGGRNDYESTETLMRAIELGVDYFDTADYYGRGHNETLIGMNLLPFRDKIRIGTKISRMWDSDSGEDAGISNEPRYLRAAVEASLRRLQVAEVDILFLHRLDPGRPLEETMQCLGDLRKEGKTRAIGLSEVSAATLRRAHAIAAIDAVQSEYSLWWREPELDVLPACLELGLTFMAFAPMGRGFLAGSAPQWMAMPDSDYRRQLPRFQPGNAAKNQGLLDALAKEAALRQCTPAQLSLAWLLCKHDLVLPIPGTRLVRHLEDNVGAAEIDLSPDDVARLDALFPIGAAAGPRYPESELRVVGV